MDSISLTTIRIVIQSTPKRVAWDGPNALPAPAVGLIVPGFATAAAASFIPALSPLNLNLGGRVQRIEMRGIIGVEPHFRRVRFVASVRRQFRGA